MFDGKIMATINVTFGNSLSNEETRQTASRDQTIGYTEICTRLSYGSAWLVRKQADGNPIYDNQTPNIAKHRHGNKSYARPGIDSSFV